MNFIDRRLERLAELQRQRPQFAELLVFYQALYGFFRQQEQPLLTLNPDQASAASRAAQGFPLLTAENLNFDRERLLRFLDQLLELLAEHGQQGQASLHQLKTALVEQRVQPEELLSACFERRREPLVQTAGELGIEATILAYVCDMTLSFAMRSAVDQLSPDPPATWREGVCPTCGGLPSIAELSGEEGTRRLHCGTCGTDWAFSRQICPFCGNQEKQEKEYFTAGDERGYRVDLCRVCNCYLKTVDGRESVAGLPMDIEDLITLHLDILAQREGFSQGKKPLS